MSHFDETFKDDVITSVYVKRGFFGVKERLQFNFVSGRRLKIKPTHSVSLMCSIIFEGPVETSIRLPSKRLINEGKLYVWITGPSMFNQQLLEDEDFDIVQLMKVERIIILDKISSYGSVFIKGTVDYSNNSIGTFYLLDKEISGKQNVSIQIMADTINLPLAFGNLRNQIGLIVSNV